MPKANKKAKCEPHTSDTVPPEEETNFEHGSESEEEMFTRQPQMPTTGLLMMVCTTNSSNGR